MTALLELKAKFDLPDWFPPERLDYIRYQLYSPGHAWAGQVDKTHYENSAVDAITNLKGFREICCDPMGKWIVFEIDTDKNIANQIQEIGQKLDRFLKRYKESKAA